MKSAAGHGSEAMLDLFFNYLRLIRRCALILVWLCIACILQSFFLLSKKVFFYSFGRMFWRIVCQILGMKIRLIGVAASSKGNLCNRPKGQRPVIYVANHSSWLDIAAIGGCLNACFVAKEEVGHWPIIGLIAHLGRTLYVSRQRRSTGREHNNMLARLTNGDNLILFPEGTSSDGSRVLPFLSAFFALAKPTGTSSLSKEIIPVIQPVSIVYDQLDGMPVGKSRRFVFAWYGDMELAPHFFSFIRWKSSRVSVLLHNVIDPLDFDNRKDLAQAAWTLVAYGAASLRQAHDTTPQSVIRQVAGGDSHESPPSSLLLQPEFLETSSPASETLIPSIKQRQTT